MDNLENQYYVYFLVDTRNKEVSYRLPFYIGKGKDKRAEDHLKETYENTENKKKWAYICGLQNKGFEPEIHYIYENLNEDLAYDIERNLIKFYGRKDIDENGILTNICPDNRPPSPKGKIRSKEHCKNLSLALTNNPNTLGRIPWNKDMPCSEEQKQNISIALTGRPSPKSKSRPVICVETGEIFYCPHAATKKYGGDIKACVYGHQKTAAGLHWKFAD